MYRIVMISIAFLLAAALVRAGERAISAEVIVNAPVSEVWNAWTTEEGVKSFLAPAAHVDARVDGPFEILFDPSKPAGEQGSEGMRFLAIQPMKMIAFTWNAPPHLPEIRKQRTHVTVRFERVDETHTRVNLTHVGWGSGGQWDEAFVYFQKAWNGFVFPALRKRFETR